MSKLQVALLINNFILFAVSCHVILSTWIDHTPIPFAYFYIMCFSLIFNAVDFFFTARATK